jgi:alginate O-acetyltransferase complex protein AlgI
MVFSSHLFVFYFLPAVLALYFLLPRRARNLGLTAVSYVFYGWSNPAFMVLMLFSTVVDYACGLVIGQVEPAAPRSRRQRIAVVASVITNLGLLGFFKYFNFGVDSYNALVAALGLPAAATEQMLRVTLPLGISFYTFQSMSYTLDVYRGRSAPLADFVDFACYVSMFPQLVAGPILRFNEVALQLAERRHSLAKAARGVAFFALGMAKKILLANPCGKVADLAFEAGSVAVVDAWYGLFAYAFQIYFDFSGYSDMAIGLGLLLGFTFPKNFDSPYRAASVTEFWRRWHISLSTWLKDYLYLPLGGNRRGPRRTYINLFLVMLLGGLWHGASWNFVLWGGAHGALLAVERRRGKRGLFAGLPRPLAVAGTFLLVALLWVPFRAPDLARTLAYYRDLFALGEAATAAALVGAVARAPYLLLTCAVAAVVVWAAPQTWDWTHRLSPARLATALALFGGALAAMETQGFNPFIYFIF